MNQRQHTLYKNVIQKNKPRSHGIWNIWSFTKSMTRERKQNHTQLCWLASQQKKTCVGFMLQCTVRHWVKFIFLRNIIQIVQLSYIFLVHCTCHEGTYRNHFLFSSNTVYNIIIVEYYYIKRRCKLLKGCVNVWTQY